MEQEQAKARAQEQPDIVASMSKLMDQVCISDEDEYVDEVDQARDFKKAKTDPEGEAMDTEGAAAVSKPETIPPRKPARAKRGRRWRQGVTEIARQQAVATNAFMDLVDDLEAEEDYEFDVEFGEFKLNRETFTMFTSDAPTGTHKPKASTSTALVSSSGASSLPPWPVTPTMQGSAPTNILEQPFNGLRPFNPPDI